MTMRVRVVLAGALTLGLSAGYWLYQAWPAWFGDEVYVAATVGARDPRSSRAAIEFPDSRLALDLPAASAGDAAVPHTVVRQIGQVWPPGPDPERSAQQLRGRMLYVQMGSRGEEAEGARRAARPVSVSTTLIEGATNVGVHAVRVERSGRMRITLGPPFFPVPQTLPQGTPVWAVLKVLPSGRYAMVGLVTR